MCKIVHPVYGSTEITPPVKILAAIKVMEEVTSINKNYFILTKQKVGKPAGLSLISQIFF